MQSSHCQQSRDHYTSKTGRQMRGLWDSEEKDIVLARKLVSSKVGIAMPVRLICSIMHCRSVQRNGLHASSQTVRACGQTSTGCPLFVELPGAAICVKMPGTATLLCQVARHSCSCKVKYLVQICQQSGLSCFRDDCHLQLFWSEAAPQLQVQTEGVQEL